VAQAKKMGCCTCRMKVQCPIFDLPERGGVFFKGSGAISERIQTAATTGYSRHLGFQ
jgi:hypothetical protein